MRADGSRPNEGKPLKFKSPKELQDKIDRYFKDCDPHVTEVSEWEIKRDSDGKKIKDEHGYDKLIEIKRIRMTEQKPYTVTGLALALDTSRKVLVEYEDRKEYGNTIKAAKNKIENFVEQGLLNSKVNVTGAIFNLKNNYNWTDKQEIDQHVSGDMTIEVVDFKNAKD